MHSNAGEPFTRAPPAALLRAGSTVREHAMAFTDNCDLYAAVYEGGVNRVISHIMSQRPSLFNYATADVAANQKLWCSTVAFTPDVLKYGNPLFTILDPLPLLGADSPPVSIGFCAQLTQAEVDFHPGNTIQLPPELNPPLPEQHFSLYLRLCGSIECAYPDLINHIPTGGDRAGKGSGPPVILHGNMQCFCLDVFAIGHVEWEVVSGQESLLAMIDDMAIVDLAPKGLEENLVCYLKTTVNVVLREKLTIALNILTLNFSVFGLANVSLAPTQNPPVPNNPAVEDDQVKVFITMQVS
jgi:hypothetical protein